MRDTLSSSLYRQYVALTSLLLMQVGEVTALDCLGRWDWLSCYARLLTDCSLIAGLTSHLIVGDRGLIDLEQVTECVLQ